MTWGIRWKILGVAIALWIGAVLLMDTYVASALASPHSSRTADDLVVAFAAASLAVLAASMLYAARALARYARTVTEVARRLTSGDLDARTGASGNDGLAPLGRALDQFAQRTQSTQQQLQQERDLLRGMLEAMHEGVLLVDADGHVALANGALRTMLMVGPNVHGMRPLEMVRNSALKRLLDDAVRARETLSAELELGDVKPTRVLVHASAIRSEPRGVVAVFVDVSELRRLETVRRDFVANVSHELRTPVAALTSATETLRGVLAPAAQDATDFLDIISRNSAKLRDLIEDLLDLARIESRALKLNLEPVSVANVARQVTLLWAERTAKKQFDVRLDVGAGTPDVQADRKALEHVIGNLFDNAVKYCPEFAVITIHAQAREAVVRIVVEDSGPGIEARHLPRLFERFYRADAGRSRDSGGTGLGLAIVKHLVEAMGGTTWVESSPGAGARFFVDLPRAV